MVVAFVLNGAQGLSEALAQALSQGVAGLQMARKILGNGGNGTGAPDEDGEVTPKLKERRSTSER